MVDKSRSLKRRRKSASLLERVNPNAAAIDCGAAEHYVAVAPNRDPMHVRSFRTFTADLHRLADWLVSCGIDTVAMEATGVFWIPVYEILEERKLEVLLVNARQFRNVAGRKSDVSDAEWLQELHSVGLLRASFRPAADIVVLRGYLRHRETLLQSATTVINRMQKAMVQMNLQLQSVISDITGATGMRIVRDIVAGLTDPQLLAKHRDARCGATKAEIAAALTGHYRPEHLFALKQNLELFDVYQAQVQACDVEIETHLGRLAAATAKPVADSSTPAARRHKARGNEPRFEVRGLLERMTGADLALIDGIGPYTALRLISEIGYDMSRWPTERHFTSWLTLAPQNRISGGRLLSSKTRASANRAAAILRVAAMTLGRTQTALGAFYRRLAYRVGKAKAITATARKLAVLVYRCLKGDFVYNDAGSAAYEARQREAALGALRRRAHHFGFALVNQHSGEIIEGGVS
jgi:transposase